MKVLNKITAICFLLSASTSGVSSSGVSTHSLPPNSTIDTQYITEKSTSTQVPRNPATTQHTLLPALYLSTYYTVINFTPGPPENTPNSPSVSAQSPSSSAPSVTTPTHNTTQTTQNSTSVSAQYPSSLAPSVTTPTHNTTQTTQNSTSVSAQSPSSLTPSVTTPTHNTTQTTQNSTSVSAQSPSSLTPSVTTPTHNTTQTTQNSTSLRTQSHSTSVTTQSPITLQTTQNSTLLGNSSIGNFPSTQNTSAMHKSPPSNTAITENPNAAEQSSLHDINSTLTQNHVTAYNSPHTTSLIAAGDSYLSQTQNREPKIGSSSRTSTAVDNHISENSNTIPTFANNLTETPKLSTKPKEADGDDEGHSPNPENKPEMEMTSTTSGVGGHSHKCLSPGEHWGFCKKLIEPVAVKVLVGEESALYMTGLRMRQLMLVHHQYLGAYSVDYHFHKSLVFFTSYGGKIARKQLSKHQVSWSTHLSQVIVRNVIGVADLAVDWVKDRLYWLTDEGHLEAADLDGHNRRSLRTDVLAGEHPSIAVDPYKRYIFYIDNQELLKVPLDEIKLKNKSYIVKQSFKRIVSFAVDRTNARLYWNGKDVDNKIKLTSSNYSGSDVKTYQLAKEYYEKDGFHIGSIDVLRSHLVFVLYTDGASDVVKYVNLFVDPINATTIMTPQTFDDTTVKKDIALHGIKIFHPGVQSTKYQCVCLEYDYESKPHVWSGL